MKRTRSASLGVPLESSDVVGAVPGQAAEARQVFLRHFRRRHTHLLSGPSYLQPNGWHLGPAFPVCLAFSTM
jgi:hypothetical protein